MNILFVCVHNAGRSQMAEAFLNALAPKGMIAISAGTEPAAKVNPIVALAMAEKNIDIANKVPALLTPELVSSSDMIITMGCGVKESCPAYLGIHIDEDWNLEDPAGRPIEEVRNIRDAVYKRVQALIAFSDTNTPLL